ncbi:recombinase family protein [Lacipirellula sp.]|uniref:recombinase family protein n=1 Tax=Lacipirellula sp. TaxID=2691419 RepID=UPI003D1278BF
MALRIIGYVRTSTEDQSLGREAQRSKLLQFAALHDLELVTILEDAESGATLDRAGLQAALAMLERGEADGLAVVKLDRLTRSLRDWSWLVENPFRHRELLSVQDAVDTRTAAGRLVLNVLLSVAEWERSTIGERTSQALQVKIARGERVGSVKYGYRLRTDGVTLVEDAAEQAVIQRARELRRDGLVLRSICEVLSEEGHRPRAGVTWNPAQIGRMVASTGGRVAV